MSNSQRTSYGLNIFTPQRIKQLEEKISLKKIQNPHIVCLIRNKEISLKPEEIVRQ
jgi:type I restriction enzyme M protein